MLISELNHRLMVERFGTGPPHVLALHGWGRSRLDWRPVLTGLDGLAPDLPGFGTSPPPPEAWGSRDYARFMLPLLAKLGRSVLVGHSFGGRVAVQLAVAAPDLVGALVLTGVPLYRLSAPYRPPLSYRLGRRLHRLGFIKDAAMDQLRFKHGSTDYRNATGIMRQVLVRVVNETYERELAELRIPVQLIWGEDDRTVPVQVASKAERSIPGASLKVVAGSGHLLNQRLAERLRAAVVDAWGQNQCMA